ncbi:hypothetical protein V6N11_050097 [Hibiscus sabdariffa]
MRRQPCKDFNRSKVSSTNPSSSGGSHFPILEDSVEKKLASSGDQVELFSVERSWFVALHVGVITSVGNQITRVKSHVVQSVAGNHSTISILDAANERCQQSLVNVGGQQVVSRRGVGDSLKANSKLRKGISFAASGEVDHAIASIMVPRGVGVIGTSESNARGH